MNKTVPMDLLWLIAFFEQCQAADKVPASLRRSRRKNSKKRRRRLIFPLLAAVIQAIGSIVTRIPTIIEAINAIAMTNDMTIVTEIINATIILIAKTRTKRTKSPTRRRMIASAITSRKRVTKPYTTTSPLHQAWTEGASRKGTHLNHPRRRGHRTPCRA
jgi:hypothetical protein